MGGGTAEKATLQFAAHEKEDNQDNQRNGEADENADGSAYRCTTAEFAIFFDLLEQINDFIFIAGVDGALDGFVHAERIGGGSPDTRILVFLVDFDERGNGIGGGGFAEKLSGFAALGGILRAKLSDHRLDFFFKCVWLRIHVNHQICSAVTKTS